MALKLNINAYLGREAVPELLDALGRGEGLVRFVGGCVRDDLLGLSVNDIDLATRLEPAEVIERLKKAGIKAVPTGIEHGTITAISGGRPYEVTTLRRDVSTDGRRATVAFTSDWQEDAARRDFTINALSADPLTGELFDYFGGLDDLAERRVRFIGDPMTRIAEDHLRILRYFRFQARFGGDQLDAEALDACTARANDLMALSRERIADELLKLLGLPDPEPTVALMIERGIFCPVLPEIEAAAIERLRTLIAAEAAANVDGDALRRLAALIPGNPAIAESIAVRLKLSNKARKRLACAAQPAIPARPEVLAYEVGTDCAVDRLLLNGSAEDAARIASWLPPRLPIGGGALIAQGLAEGPVVARTLRAIEERWIEAGFPNGEALAAIVSEEVKAALA